MSYESSPFAIGCPIHFPHHHDEQPAVILAENQSKIVPAENHPRHKELRDAFLQSYSSWDIPKHTKIMLSALGKPLKEKKGFQQILIKDMPQGSYRPIVALQTVFNNMITITDPGLAKIILNERKHTSSESGNFIKTRVISVLSTILGSDNLFCGDEIQHDKIRSFAEPFFQYSSIKSHTQKIVDLTSELLNRWSNQDTINATADLKKFAAETIAKIYLGIEILPDELTTAINTLTQVAAQRMCFIPEVFNKGKASESLEVFQKVVNEILKKQNDDHFLVKMSKETDESGNAKFSQEEIVSMCNVLLFAGQDTLSSLLTYIVYILGKRKDLQQQLFEEYLSRDCNLTQFAQNSKLIGDIIQEALRVHPPIPSLLRKAGRDIIVDDRLFIPENWDIGIPIIFINREATRWGPDSEEFKPDRNTKGYQFGKFNFGGGVNNCIGQHIAKLIARVFIATLVSRHIWKTQNDEVDCTSGITLRLVEDIHLQLFSRDPDLL